MISVVITTYKRPDEVLLAVASAIEFTKKLPKGEVIVVDDASNDQTIRNLHNHFSTEIQVALVRVVERSENGGVTAAKNSGAKLAIHDWLLFLDSDDLLVSDSAIKIEEAIRNVDDMTQLLFFRCVDQNGGVIGPHIADPKPLDLKSYIRYGTWGESLPVIRRKSFNRHPYIDNLRGFEGISYAQILRYEGGGLVLPVVARVYNTSGDDRLSSKRNFSIRSCLIARGYAVLLKRNYSVLPLRENLILSAKFFLNVYRCVLFKLFG